MPSIRGQTVCTTGPGRNTGYTVRGMVKNSDDPKNSHLKKLEVGEEKLTLIRVEITEEKNVSFGGSERSDGNGRGVFHIEYPVADEPFLRKLSKSIVKVIRTGPPPPDFSRPHQREENDLTHESSGIILQGRRVLTCAHSVDHHIVVELKKNNSKRVYTATVLSVAIDSDLALLTVSDEKFWEGVEPVKFAANPVAPRDDVIIMGFPIDSGDQVSSVECEVTNVDMITYLHWGTKLLAFQVNEQIKEGTSGGLVCNLEGECLGMPFQSSGTIGDVIPVAVIEHFLLDYDNHGAYTGIPILVVKWQNMVNPDLRKSKKMENDQQGVRITEVTPNYPESEILKRGDVLVNIDGIDIGNDGKVPFAWGQRIEFSYLVTKKYTGDIIVLKVIRDSEIKELSIKLTTHKQFIQENIGGRPLPYYIMAGFVFTTISFPYLESLGRRRRFYQYSQEELESQSLYKEGKCRREELLSQALYEERVVVCELLKDDINVGYQDEKGILHSQVLTFNGMPVQSLQSLASMVENWDGEFLKIILENQKDLDVETNKARASIKRILGEYDIPSAMSSDLKEKLIVAEQGGQHDWDSDWEFVWEWPQELDNPPTGR